MSARDDDVLGAATAPGPASPPPSSARVDGPPSTGGDDALLVELNALLGRGTRYEGKLHFTGRVRVEGDLEGEIRGDGVLVIGTGAQVKGTIRVDTCIVTGGEVTADVFAYDAIELHAPAEVHGDLHAPNVFIDRGVKFEGACKMAPLDPPKEGTPPFEGGAGSDELAPPQPTMLQEPSPPVDAADDGGGDDSGGGDERDDTGAADEATSPPDEDSTSEKGAVDDDI